MRIYISGHHSHLHSSQFLSIALTIQSFPFCVCVSVSIFLLAMAASTSTSTSGNVHDVFINHRGPDLKMTFASHLYRRLISYNLRVFLDYQELEEGENLDSQIKEAIVSASVHVAIFSPTYAESKWCLDELQLMLESGSPIIPVFHRVKPADLRWTHEQDKGLYATALNNHKNKRQSDGQLRYNSTTVESWRNALFRAAGISGFELAAFNGDEGELVDKVVECVLKRVKKPELDVAKYPTGLDEKVQDFERTVLSQQHSGRAQVVGIAGMGGVGKTTLAKELFNRKTSNHSKNCFLFDVRENAKSLYILQRKLLKSLIQFDWDIDSVDQGKGMLRHYLKDSRVLLVLDDVDDLDQVDALLPLDVLHRDSFILITSRNRNVLEKSGIRESSIYHLRGLDAQHSRELFCSYAFCQPHPLSGFESLADQFLKACNGLPLSLKVFGGLVWGNTDKSYWEDQLDRLQQTLPDEIQKRLQISYDALHREEKQIFLDISCFFIGLNRETAIRIWDGSGWRGSLGFRTLQEKCLVEVGIDNKIIMHDQLRDMGRDLAKESALPRRIWHGLEDIHDGAELRDRIWRWMQQSYVITDVRGIKLSHSDYEYASFPCSKIKNLQLLDASDVPFLRLVSLGYEHGSETLLKPILSSVLSPNLIWLRWQDCPYSALPSWIPVKNLRVLEVDRMTFQTLWQSESQIPLELRELQIDGPAFQWPKLQSDAPLLNIPKSIGQCKHLERIVVNDHSNFENLPEEFGLLRSLKVLVFKSCKKLRFLPDSFGNLTNLEHIDLSHCSGLETLPKSFGNLKNLEHIDLSHCGVMEKLPNSFRNLTNLEHFHLSHCSGLETLPNSFGNLTNLKHIDLSYCSGLETLPNSFGNLTRLEKLNLTETNLEELPGAIGKLCALEEFTLQSPLLETLPPSIGDLKSLRYLMLWRCEKLKCLPDSMRLLNQLTKMTVCDCSLGDLPFKRVEGESETLTRLQQLELTMIQKLDKVSFGEGVCPHLQDLVIWRCGDLAEIGKLPNALIKLELKHCYKLRKIEGLCGLAKLQELNINLCTEVEELSSIETLVSLETLRVFHCCNLKSIRGLGQLTKLRFLNMSGFPLEELPDLQQLILLERLETTDSSKLKSIQGLAQLKKLQGLIVDHCRELEVLPGVEHLRSLSMLSASGCPKLQWAGGAVEQFKRQCRYFSLK